MVVGNRRMVAFRVLGPLAVTIGETDVALAGVRQRRLLAALLLRVGRPVPMAALLEAVWNDEPPRSAINSVQSYASRLRGLLGTDALVWTGAGYELRMPPDTVDAVQFESLIDRARSETDPAAALDLLDRALALWNDEAYPDLAHYEPATAQAVRLAELCLTARELRADALLAAGLADNAVASLQALTVEHPLRERPWEGLMRALHRTGRQADALAAFRRYDHILAEQGLETGESVRELRTAILATPESVRGPAIVEIATPPLAVVRGRAPLSATPPAQLPPPTAAFTGRRGQLEGLDELLTSGSTIALVIAAVAGSAGVGKTALAVQWAHRVRDRFPDGQLFVDLQGYATGQPLRPIDALTGFLTALGVPAEQRPIRLDEASALYRSLVAGRRMLIVLDNAGSPEHVRSLLPGEPGCLVLVTSRDRLSGLVARDGARPFRLDAFSPDEAHELLTRLLGEARVAAEPESTMDLARACAYLPLALRVAAATLAWQPDWRIDQYVERLRNDRLNALAIDGDPDSTVGVAFDTSYRMLSTPVQRLFRLLGPVPGSDISVPAVAALAGQSESEAAALLDRLAAAHLLDSPARGRYTCHDLLRCYAVQRSAQADSTAERAAAMTRLYGWYAAAVNMAADLLHPHMLRLPRAAQLPQVAAPFACDHAGALAWLDTERRNLVAMMRHIAPSPVDTPGADPAAKPLAYGCLIADGLRGYFHLGRHGSDWITVAQAGLAAAEDIGDLCAQEAARHSLGTACRSLGDHRLALRHYARALWLARRCGWREAEATTLGNLGIICGGQGRLRAAVVQLTRALAIDRETGRRAGVANNLGNLATVYLDQGRLTQAVAHFTEALDLNRATDSWHGQALALTGLGQALRELGRLTEATERLTEALGHYRKVGDRDGQAVIYSCLAMVDCDLGLLISAQARAQTACDLARQNGDPRTEADSLAALGSALERMGHHGAAWEHYRRAHDLVAGLAVRRQIEVLVGLAGCALCLGDIDGADRPARLAVYRASRSGYRVTEAVARVMLGRIELARGNLSGALEQLQSALIRHRETGHRAGEAHALRLLSEVHRRSSRPDEADQSWLVSAAIFGELGLTEAHAARS